MSSFLEDFGISLEEGLEAKAKSYTYLNGPKARLALQVLRTEAPLADRKSRDTLHQAWARILSEAGKGVAVLMGGDGNPKLNSLFGYVDACLIDPICWCDPATWALFYSTREASDDLQLDNCPTPTSESHLSGALIGALRRSCEQWRTAISGPLERQGVILSLDQLDLSILGGEQATGGDFALVLELSMLGEDGSASQRAVPLIFQAKRYVRPNADVSQRHHIRGYQRQILSQNRCASAYIFYENGSSQIELPLPPLVKPVVSVGQNSRTEATNESMDLASYLVTRLHSPELAMNAPNAEEALRMIYSGSSPSRIAVLASDEMALSRYQAALSNLAHEFVDSSDEPPLTTEE